MPAATNNGAKLLSTTKAASVLGRLVKAMKELKNYSPSKTKQIMQEVTAVLLITSARL